MAERKESSFTGRELAGVALFTLSIFPVVLVALALAKGGAGEAGGTAALARGLIESVGYWPVLFCGAGFAAVGATLVLSSREIEVGRHLSGALFGAIGLAIILGAFHDQPTGLLHGGAFGAATGGALRAVLGAWAGALVGGAILFVSVWLAWLGGRIVLPAAKRKPESAATLSDALTEKDSDGVTAAEATALVPDASTLAYMEELWRRTAASSAQTVPVPPSPYPDDVRLKGAVPEGARPLPTSDESTATSGQAEAPAAGRQAPPPGPPAELGAGPDLALAGEAGGGPGADPFGREAQELSLSPEAARALAGSPSDPAPPRHPGIPEGARPLVVEDVGSVAGGPPVPTWEVAEEDQGSETSLVRRAHGEEDDPEEDPKEPVVGEVEASEPDLEEADLVEEEELEDEAEEDDDDEEAAEYEDDPDAEYEEEEDVDAEGEYEEVEEEEDEDELAAEYEEEDEADEDLEEEAELDDDEEWEEEDEDEAAELDEEEEDDDEAAELDEEEEEEAAEPEEEPAATRGEPEVVLQPHPAPEGAPDRTRLVFDAGRLFLEQGRVAVSLLQRRFGLEFDEACEVLDELQEVGLIGPYRGGQKRDILLSPEEWEIRAEAL